MIKEIGKSTLELAQNEVVLNKSEKIFGMLFPYAGLEKKAVDVYIDEIKKSNLSPETKAFCVLKARKTMKKLKNQSDIVDIAIKNAKEGTDFTEKSGVDEEWLDRFMDSAGYVLEDDMKVVWGKILANEFESHGSTPPNMTRILSEITTAMAQAFVKICSMKIWICPIKDDLIGSDNIETMVPFVGNENFMNSIGVSFKVLNELETIGLIKLHTSASYIANVDGLGNKVLICYGDKNIIISSKEIINQLPLGNVMLTNAGDSLAAITEDIYMRDYFNIVIDYFKTKKYNIEENTTYNISIRGDSLKYHK